MDLKTKLLKLCERSYYFIVIAQGEIDRKALKRIFDEIEKTNRHVNCKVFVDLEQAGLNVWPAAIHSMADQCEFQLSSKPIRMAVVASKLDCCGRVDLLCDVLCSQGVRVALFDDTKTAASWLSDGP